MATQLNVVNAFRMPLPAIIRSMAQGSIRYVQASSTSTKATDPVRAWEDHEKDYIDDGATWLARLEQVKLRQTQVLHQYLSNGQPPPENDFPLLQKIAPLRRTIAPNSERDVTTLSVRYLIDPVMIALESLFPGLVMRFTEEKTQNDSRIDLVWEFVLPGQGSRTPSVWVEFAILEFKNTNVIHKRHFDQGRFGIARAEHGGLASRAELWGMAITDPNQTMLTSNAIVLSKQATKYSKRAPYVMMFDWDTMAIFDFYGSNQDNPTNHRFTKLSFFQENQQNTASGRTYRILLLGFLVRALRSTVDQRGLNANSYLAPL